MKWITAWIYPFPLILYFDLINRITKSTFFRFGRGVGNVYSSLSHIYVCECVSARVVWINMNIGCDDTYLHQTAKWQRGCRHPFFLLQTTRFQRGFHG